MVQPVALLTHHTTQRFTYATLSKVLLTPGQRSPPRTDRCSRRWRRRIWRSTWPPPIDLGTAISASGSLWFLPQMSSSCEPTHGHASLMVSCGTISNALCQVEATMLGVSITNERRLLKDQFDVLVHGKGAHEDNIKLFFDPRQRPADVRFGSLADIAPMSALRPKADISWRQLCQSRHWTLYLKKPPTKAAQVAP